MMRRVPGRNRPRSTCPQVLLTKALVGIIRASARQIHPSVFQEIVCSIGAEQGRLATAEWRLRRGTERQCDVRASLQRLKTIGRQYGWTIRVTVETDDLLKFTVLEYELTEPHTSGSYLCNFAAGFFAGVTAETLGHAQICAVSCPETPPLNCTFMIQLRNSEKHAARPDIVHLHSEKELVRSVGPLSDNGPVERLTPREQQVLQLIAQGFSDRQIAKALQRSVRTVENHAARIRQKLHIENRTGLVRFAFRNRLIES